MRGGDENQRQGEKIKSDSIIYTPVIFLYFFFQFSAPRSFFPSIHLSVYFQSFFFPSHPDQDKVIESLMCFGAIKIEVVVCCFYWQKFIQNIFCTFLYVFQVIECSFKVLVSKGIFILPQLFIIKHGAKVRAYLRHFPGSLKTVFFDSILFSNAFVLPPTWVSKPGTW